MFSSLHIIPNPIAGPSNYSNMQRSASDLVDDEYEYGGGDSEAEADESMFRDMTFDEVLEDLNARFMVNLPAEERTLVRLYWQAEQAHWFYEDYLRPLNPHLPSLGQRHFTQLIIASSPVLASLTGPNGIDYDQVWNDYISYKSMVPCCGAIILNREGDKCLVVRGWKSNAGWSFPRGKININEPEILCAIREVEEETGFDLTGLINDNDRIQTQVNSQSVTMYIVAGVDEATVFEAQTKNEIGAIEWVKTSDLPTWTGRKPKKSGGVKEKKFYNVTPFVGPLKKWLQQHGYNPHPSQKKKQPPPLAQAKSNRRNLQPYFEGESPLIPHSVPTPQPSQRAPEKAASALDHLFDRFITKQEEDLRSGSAEAVKGTDQKEGIRRIFGDLVTDIRDPPSAAELKRVADQSRESGRREEEDLARLLGAVPPPPSEKANRLLSLLKPTAAQQAAPPLAATSQPTSDPAPSTMMRPHQASLLSMLSPASRPPAITHPVVTPPSHQPLPSGNPPPYLAPTFSGDVLAPASASTRSSAGDEEAARRVKQQKLLEMAFGGISLDSRSSSNVSGGDGSSHPPEPYGAVPAAQTYPVDHPAVGIPHSPAKAPIPSPSNNRAARDGSNQPSPSKRHVQQQTRSSASPTQSGRRQGGSAGPTDLGYEMFPSEPHQQPPHPQYRQQPGAPSAEQHRLLAALHARPPPPPGTQPAGGGYGYPRPAPSHGLGGMTPPRPPGRVGGGYQMGVPGQPGQPPYQPPPGHAGQIHLPSNLTTNNFPPPLPSQYQPGYQPGGYPQAPPHGGNLAFRPPHPHQQHPHLYPGHPARPPYPAQPAPPGQILGQAPPGPGQFPAANPSAHQQGHQGQLPNHFGPGSVRTQQVQNQTVLQPVPVPRQAAMGLLAMINGNGELRR